MNKSSIFDSFVHMGRRKQLVLLLVLALSSLAIYRVVQAKNAAQRAQTSPVTVVQIKTTELTQLANSHFDKTLPISGALNPYQQTTVSARAAGEVSAVNVREGQSVHSGVLLATLVATTYQAQLDQARAAADSAQQNLKLAEQDYQNNLELFQSGFIAKMALQKIDVNRQSAKSSLTNAQNNVVIAERALAETRIVAPISGVVAQRKINQGDTVANGSPLFAIVNDSAFELSAPVSADQIGALAIGQTVQLTTAGIEQGFGGTIERINPAAQAGSRSYNVYIRVNNNGSLRAGMFAQGEVLLSSKPNVFTLSATAIHHIDGRDFVYVIKDGQVEQRAITVGERNGTAIDAATEVLSGVSAGETVVRMDLGNLKTGLTAQLIDDQGAVLPSSSTLSSSAPTRMNWWGKIKAAVKATFTRKSE